MAEPKQGQAKGVPNRGVTAAAEVALAASSPGACLALLAALPPPQRQTVCVRQLQALCQIQLAGRPSASQPWWKVFGLAERSASSTDVRRQYKRLAALVHPDKCACPGAAEAFKTLAAAADSLLHAVTAAAKEPAGSSRSKRARTGSGSAGQAEEPAQGHDEGGQRDSEESDGWVPDGGGFPWWEDWDSPGAVRQPAAHAAAAAAAERGDAAGQAAREAGGGGSGASAPQAAAGSGGGQQQQEQQQQQGSQQDEQAYLQKLSLEELRSEVRQRQAALLAPPLDASGRRVPLQQLQARLRQARSLLAERAAAAAAATAASSEGGFLAH